MRALSVTRSGIAPALRPILIAASVAAAAAGTPALAQNATTGQSLWDSGRGSPALLACGACHNGAADAANGLNLTFLRARLAGAGGLNQANAVAAINRALRRPGGVGVMLAAYPAGALSAADIDSLAAFIAQAPAAPAAPAAASPPSLTFQGTPANSESGMQLVTITNTSGQAITLANTPVAALTTSAHPADFLIGSNGALNGAAECSAGRIVQPAGTCALRVLFRPTAIGARSATWEVRFTQGMPVTVQLAGSGTPQSSAPTAPVAAPSSGNAGGGALHWVGLVVFAAAAALRRRR